jgi:hypothetical protein
MKFQFTNEFEKEITFPLKSKTENEFTVGVRVEVNGSILNIAAHKYQFAQNHAITNCTIVPDGDPKIQSEHSVSVHSAPEALFDSELPVLKIDYHFYGQGWKFLKVFPNNSESRKIPDKPKCLGLWVYGDNQKINIKMRINDSSHQSFQLIPEFGHTINWKGWKYVQMYLNDAESHWGGSNDSVVHYPVEYDSLLLLDNTNHSNIKSTIYISSPILIY